MKKLFKILWRILFGLFLFSILLVLIYKWLPVPITPLMVIRAYEQNQDHKEIVLKHDWVPLEEISQKLQLAVICSEDQNFLKHNGFDINAIEKAIENNKKGKRIRGGSTISQQTAKNVFLWPQRSWFRKALETYFTFLIELIWGKERIMEVYLNSIEMGNGIYGAEAASQFWYKKSVKNLSNQEAASIAAILPNPLKYRANPATTYIQSRKNWIIKQMSNHGKLLYNK
ncbi:monofunctional biosynthetic peptidoglycan transglycosylase [Hanstruepera neustonica]|uniref:Biosynthetic peptidoglycan transglycosylase n=1 Tax=Hanstruepera neustonica TaxID=1445657 RepID=A0A2K1E3I4_9FLAO|nr:monofunctional biosynthetic peptidoglycan transglycosylase [Hanstruepera neustonica]PNQ74849.1 monofunctional biosynthetic peptidoglycan transglycosylase [Hanstruepera neustonica]